MSRRNSIATTPVELGPCQCPGSPHAKDTAEIVEVLGWDDLVDIEQAATEGAAERVMVTRAIASWNLVDLGPDGKPYPVPVTEARVRLLDKAEIAALAPVVNETFKRSKGPLPNDSGEPSPGSPPENDSSTPTEPTAPSARPTSSK